MTLLLHRGSNNQSNGNEEYKKKNQRPSPAAMILPKSMTEIRPRTQLRRRRRYLTCLENPSMVSLISRATRRQRAILLSIVLFLTAIYFLSGPNQNNIDFHWHHYYSPDNNSNNSTNSSATTHAARRILISQYTGLDPAYLEFATISEKANRAYAKKWNHDYVRMNGVAFDPYRPGGATYNKIALIEKAMSARVYDALLILDADAVIIDLDQDALDLIPRDMLLTAHRVHSDDDPHTWHVNIGVTLWNLRHEKIKQVYDYWYRRTRRRLVLRQFPEDQSELHAILRRYGDERKSMVNAVDNTLVKFVRHVMRGTFGGGKVATSWHPWRGDEDDMKHRKLLLEQAVHDVCSKWEGACEED